MNKYDQISSDIMTYIENYTAYTPEELQAEQEMYPNKKFDKNEKPYFNITCKAKDILFGMWGNVQAKALQFEKVNF